MDAPAPVCTGFTDDDFPCECPACMKRAQEWADAWGKPCRRGDPEPTYARALHHAIANAL